MSKGLMLFIFLLIALMGAFGFTSLKQEYLNRGDDQKDRQQLEEPDTSAPAAKPLDDAGTSSRLDLSIPDEALAWEEEANPDDLVPRSIPPDKQKLPIDGDKRGVSFSAKPIVDVSKGVSENPDMQGASVGIKFKVD